MKKLFTTTLLAAGILIAPSLALAGNYNNDVSCQQKVNNQRTTGGLVGAGLGAVAGNQLASRSNRSEGAVLGAVLGAVVGSEVGRRNAACDDNYQLNRRQTRRADRDYADYNRNDYNNSRYDDDYNDGYRARRISYNAPIRHNNRCGWGTAAYRLPNGRVVHDQVWMCRQRNGEWVVNQR